MHQVLKPMLHALLIPGSLTYLSVASNRRLKAAAFKLIGAYVAKVRFAVSSALSDRVTLVRLQVFNS